MFGGTAKHIDLTAKLVPLDRSQAVIEFQSNSTIPAANADLLAAREAIAQLSDQADAATRQVREAAHAVA